MARCSVVWRGRWHVTMPLEETELAPVFDRWTTAAEVAGKFEEGHAFFGEIPTVPLGTEYPRPGRMQPADMVDLLRHMPSDRVGRVQARTEAAHEATEWGLSLSPP